MKTIWITGASSGIGEALAKEYALQGHKLILSARNTLELERVKSQCHNSEQHILAPLDLSDYHALEEKVTTLVAQLGPVDILINNAGISQRYLVNEGKITLDEQVIATNLLGTIAMTRPILQDMLKYNQGQIVIISSMLGLFGMQTRSAYAASKHGLRGYFESLRNELASTNISVSLVYPGYAQTRIAANSLVSSGEAYGDTDTVHAQAMSPVTCAHKIIRGVTRHKPVIVVSAFKERFGAFVALYLPALFRKIAPKFKV